MPWHVKVERLYHRMEEGKGTEKVGTWNVAPALSLLVCNMGYMILMPTRSILWVADLNVASLCTGCLGRSCKS